MEHNEFKERSCCESKKDNLGREGKVKNDGPLFGSKSKENFLALAMVLAGILIIFNQVQVSSISGTFNGLVGAATSGGTIPLGGSVSLEGVDVNSVTSTPMAVATVFPELQGMRDENEILNFMIPTGTPEYSEALGGITFDDPVSSMEYLAKWYPSLKQEVKTQHPDLWERYLNLAAAPRGVSCEYCCGVGPQAVDKEGNLMCGCQHAPALQSIALGLMLNTNYSDAQVLREVMRWKTIFFPQNMVGVAMQVAGTDPSQLKDLPGMVGGC